MHTSSNTFKYGVRLEYVRFVKITNCHIWGQEAYTPTAENPNAVAGISILCSDTVGQFGFLLTNNFVSGFTCAVKAEGWFEGLYVTGGEYWVAYYGFFLTHPAVSANSPMTGTVKISNLHANGAMYPMYFNNISCVGVNNCDIQNGTGGGNSNNPALMFFNSCPRVSVTGCSMQNFYSNKCNGIFLQGGDNAVVSGNTITDVTDNVFLIVNNTNTAIISNSVVAMNFTPGGDVYAVNGSGLISKNNFTGKPVTPGGLQYDPPRIQYIGVATLTAGANNITVTPIRPLTAKPNAVIVTTEYSSAGAVNAYYNYFASSTTAIVITLNAATAGTYRYSVEYPLN